MRDLAAAGREPVLVVPTWPDVERLRRELAADGVVFGVEVMVFGGLLRLIGRRAGVRDRPVERLTRERLACAAVATTELRVLASAADTAGFPRALLRLVTDLQEARIEPPRFIAALRAWSQGADERSVAYAEELGALYLGYRRALDRLGRRDEQQVATAALDALRLRPHSWGTTPVLLYGFDDLTRPQLDAIDALGNRAGADVRFALTFEAGREATAARATTRAELIALGATERVLEPADTHYAEGARPVLHHIERSLLVPGAGRVDPGTAVIALAGGGERAEAELVAGHVARLITRESVPPEEVAIVHRDLRTAGALLTQVLRAYGVPAALELPVPAGHTALGRGLVAMLRAATAPHEATADELLLWLRTPGLLDRADLADALERRCRRAGIRTATAARAAWEESNWPLDALDRVAQAAGRGPRALCERLATEVVWLLERPFVRRAHVMEGDEAADARVAARLVRVLQELGRLPAWLAPAPAELARTLAAVEEYLGEPPGPGRVTVSTPMALRARRVRVLVVMGLQEGTFPAPRRPEPLLGDDDRRGLNSAAGLGLPIAGDRLAAERHLFYVTVSRPTDQLVLAWHEADDDGQPVVRSPLAGDVADLLTGDLLGAATRRPLGASGWDGHAPTPREARRAAVAAAAARPAEPLGPLREPDAVSPGDCLSASALETWTACPVKWFVERRLRPDALVPDPEPLVRGNVAHRVLERAVRGVGGPLEPSLLPEARRLLRSALAEQAASHAISVNPERMRAEVRRLEVDLVGMLEHAFRRGSAFSPAHFELAFGGPDDALGPLELLDGELRLTGRIDRVDLGPDGTSAIVYDYKGRTAPKPADWVPKGRLQMALYMLAVEQLLGVRAAGGFYQPVNAAEPEARGVLREEEDPGVRTVGGDRRPDAEVDELLEQCRDAALQAARELRAGRLRARPDTCAYRGGCAYPTLCRCPEAAR